MTNMKKNVLVKFGIVLLSIAVFATTFPIAFSAVAKDIVDKSALTTSESNNQLSYTEYCQKYPDTLIKTDSISLSAENYSKFSGTAPVVYDNYEGDVGASVLLSEDTNAQWSFNVAEDGWYNLQIKYYPFKGTGSPILRDINIDGAVPYKEAQSVTFTRLWSNASPLHTNYDVQGNELLCSQVEAPAWNTITMEDSSGCAGQLGFYLTKGNHTVSLNGVRDPLLIKSLSWNSKQTVQTYKDISETYAANNYKSVSDDTVIVLQGEDANTKSDQSLHPLADRTSPTTVPYDLSCTCYNTIGGNQWKTAGQWIEWTVDVKQDGLYSISTHFKQAIKSGVATIRELYIDGELPFKEATNLTFPYNNSWQLSSFSDKSGNPYKFYFTKGPHTIRMQVGLGDNAEILTQAQELLSELNTAYREIVVVTGTSPDTYRDYHFDKLIPDTLKNLDTINQNLKKLEESIHQINTDSNKNIAEIERLCTQIDTIIAKPRTIAYLLSAFKNNIASFGTWTNGLMEQPLELDYMMLTSVNVKLDKGDAGFFGLCKHYFLQFLSSFVMDYSTIGNTGADTESKITVWITTGRDQAQILKQLINSDFTPQSNVTANVQLVSVGSLLPAVLAGIGPDVSLGLVETDPLNLALRNGIVDLSKLDNYNELANRFNSSLIEPFKFNNGVWALPDTQIFTMLFYRKDILSDLGISTDNLTTWNSILEHVLPKLENSSLTFGIMPTFNNYQTFLFQRNGDIYNGNGTSSALNSSAAISAMDEYSMLYSQYGLPLTYDFANRFRSGEIPLAVADFTAYNQLTVFAPEIKGLWGMLPMPGIADENGNVNSTTSVIVTGNVILSSTDNLDGSWKFLKWWSSANTQSSYGTLLESIVGSAARYNSANTEAFSSVQWDSDIKTNLNIQQKSLKALEEVPGGYITSRMYSFAFRNIVYDDAEVRETMNDTADDITKELVSKRQEYKLAD